MPDGGRPHGAGCQRQLQPSRQPQPSLPCSSCGLLPSAAVSATVGEPQRASAPATGAAVPAVSLSHVRKSFRLPQEQYHTLKERVLHPFRARNVDILKAVDDISLEIATGEFFGIVGRNGSGKSTLLKCLAGIYDTDGGELRVNG